MSGLLSSQENITSIIESGLSLIDFYRNDPVAAAFDLLRIDLAPIQRVVLRDMWFKNFVITVMGRGGGKSQSVDSMSFIDGKGLCYLYEEFKAIPKFLRSNETLEIESDNIIYTSEGFKLFI